MSSNDKVIMSVTMTLTKAQAIALREMFEYWNRLASIGSSRHVSFFADGDGNFHPRCLVETNPPLPEISQDMKDASIISDNDGDRKYDYDKVGWMLEREKA
jgi:hypothetical protein